jgi:hypothetical protein
MPLECLSIMAPKHWSEAAKCRTTVDTRPFFVVNCPREKPRAGGSECHNAC